MANRYIDAAPQYFSNAGAVLAGCKLYLYESGTDTLKAIYNDNNQITAIANPVVYAADGRTPNVFFEGTARAVLTDSSDVQVWDRDPIGIENLQSNLSLWSNAVNYDQFDLVRGSDGNYYKSLQNDNLGNDPTESPTDSEYWEQIFFNRVWNQQITYNTNDLVYENAILYKSIVDSNLGNAPSTSPAQWLTETTSWQSPQTVDFTIVSGRQYPIDASGAAVDAALPTTLAVGDPFTLHNQANSTNTVRVTNTSFTIRGPASSASAGDNVVIAPGQTLNMVAVTTLILEIV